MALKKKVCELYVNAEKQSNFSWVTVVWESGYKCIMDDLHITKLWYKSQVYEGYDSIYIITEYIAGRNRAMLCLFQ